MPYFHWYMLSKLLNLAINTWISTTGKSCSYQDYPWLRGPMSEDASVGSGYYAKFAALEGLTVESPPDAGLIADFSSVIGQSDANYGKLNPRIAHFYEHTKAYKLEVWSKWYRPMKFFANILIRSLSPKMDQLNIPLDPLETSRGMTNDVLQLKDPSGKMRFACWLRKTVLSGRVVYAGFYSGIEIGGKKYVRVIFPLPDGNVTVVLSVIVLDDGSVKLLSGGKKIGEAGYYRVRRHTKDAVKVKYVPLKESIHVFEDETGTLRTDHEFWFLGSKMLHLHYKIMGK
jgi:hypothetical protein